MRYVPSAVRRSLRAVGEHCSVQRKLFSLTVADVAQRSGVSENTVRNVEHGRAVRTDSLFAILDVLQMLEPVTDASDPYNSDLGKLRALEQLPQRVRR